MEQLSPHVEALPLPEALEARGRGAAGERAAFQGSDRAACVWGDASLDGGQTRPPLCAAGSAGRARGRRVRSAPGEVGTPAKPRGAGPAVPSAPGALRRRGRFPDKSPSAQDLGARKSAVAPPGLPLLPPDSASSSTQ